MAENEKDNLAYDELMKYLTKNWALALVKSWAWFLVYLKFISTILLISC